MINHPSFCKSINTLEKVVVNSDTPNFESIKNVPKKRFFKLNSTFVPCFSHRCSISSTRSSSSSANNFRESLQIFARRLRYKFQRIWQMEDGINSMDSDFTDLSTEYWSPHLRMAVAEIGHEFRCSVRRKLRKMRYKSNRNNASTNYTGIAFCEEEIDTGTTDLGTGSATAVATPLKGIGHSSTNTYEDSIYQMARPNTSIDAAFTFKSPESKSSAELFPCKTSYFQWLSQLVKKYPIDITETLQNEPTTATSMLTTTCPIIDKSVFDVSPDLLGMVRLNPFGLQFTTGLTKTEFEHSLFAASSTETATAVMSEQESPTAKMQMEISTELAWVNKSFNTNEQCNDKCQNSKCWG